MADKSYVITDTATGRRLKVTGPSAPTEAEAAEMFANPQYADAKSVEDAQAYVEPAPVGQKFSESPRVKAEREAREYYRDHPLKENPNTPAWMNDPNRPMLPVDYANQWAKEGVVRAITGAKSFAEPAEGSGLTPSEVRAKRVQAGRDMLGGTVTAAAPVAAAAAVPALYAAPVTTMAHMLLAGGLGIEAQALTKETARQVFGLTDNESELLGEIAGLGTAAIPIAKIGPSIRAAQAGGGNATRVAGILDRILPSNQARQQQIAKYAQTLKYQSDPGPNGLQREVEALIARGNTQEAQALITKTQQILAQDKPISVAQAALEKKLVAPTLRGTLENAEQRIATIEPRLRIVADETQFPRIAKEWDELSAVLMDVAARFKTARTGTIAQEATRLASVFKRPNASGAELIRAKRLLDSLRKFNATGEISVEGTQALDLRNASNRARSQLHTNKDIDAFLKEQEASLNVAGSVLDKLAIGTKDYIQDTGGLGLLSAGSAVSGAGSGVAVASALRAFANKARLPLAKVLYRGVGGKTTPIPALPPRAAVNFGASTPPSAGQPTPPNAGPTLPPGANKSAVPPSNTIGGPTTSGPTPNGPTRPSSGNQRTNSEKVGDTQGKPSYGQAEQERSKASQAEEANSKVKEEQANATRKAQADARQRAEANARQRAETDARQKAEANARQRSEADARQKAQDEARQKTQRAQADARRRAQADARRRAQADARRRAQEDARRRGEEAGRRAQEEAGRSQRDRQGRRNERPNTGRTQVPDPYDALGVNRNATAAEIKSAYRDLARKNHPDTVAGTMGNMLNPEAMKVKIDEATARMKIINAAWDRLKPRK